MSFSKLSLLAAAAALSLTGLSAHADSLNLGTSIGSFSVNYQGNHETVASGNYAGSSAIIGGNTVKFDAVYSVDLDNSISGGQSYSASFTGNGQIFGSNVHNAAEIAWLLLNSVVTNTTQSEGLQAAIWEVEYGNQFSLGSGQSGISNAENAYLNALNYASNHGQVTNTLLDDVLWISPSSGGNDQGFRGDNQDCNYQAQGLVGLPDPAPVPEPGTLSLLGTGLAGLAAVVRRRFA